MTTVPIDNPTLDRAALRAFRESVKIDLDLPNIHHAAFKIDHEGHVSEHYFVFYSGIRMPNWTFPNPLNIAILTEGEASGVIYGPVLFVRIKDAPAEVVKLWDLRWAEQEGTGTQLQVWIDQRLEVGGNLLAVPASHSPAACCAIRSVGRPASSTRRA